MGQSLWVMYFSTVPSKPPREDRGNGLERNQRITSAFCPPKPCHSVHLRLCPVLAFHLLSLWVLTSHEKRFVVFSSLLQPALPKHPSALHFPQLASKTVAASGAGLGVSAMVMIYFWDAGLCPHLSSCECWHVLGTGKVYIAWIPGDWFRATHFEAVGQIKPMLTPPGKLPSKINMVSSSALGQCPQENQPSLWLLFLLPPQSLVGRGQWAFAGIVLSFVYVCYVYVFAYARVPSPPLLPALPPMGDQSCTAQQPSMLMERWFGAFFALSQHPQTTMRQQVINFCHFLALWPACKTFCPNTNKIWCND